MGTLIEFWQHIQMRQPKDYDKAVSLLTDLHDLAVRRCQMVGFHTELEKIRQVHGAKRRASCVDLPRQTCKW
jgi:aminoglycoside N3'-acetyltransferase